MYSFSQIQPRYFYDKVSYTYIWKKIHILYCSTANVCLGIYMYYKVLHGQFSFEKWKGIAYILRLTLHLCVINIRAKEVDRHSIVDVGYVCPLLKIEHTALWCFINIWAKNVSILALILITHQTHVYGIWTINLKVIFIIAN